MSRNVLMVVRRFPPQRASGSARPLAFSRYLPELGFAPTVLTISHPPEQPSDPEQLSRLPEEVAIHCAQPGDWERYLERCARRLTPERTLDLAPESVAQRCAERVADGAPAFPARILPMVGCGLELARRRRIHLVWATAPSWDAFKAASLISRTSGLPLILDYRDPLTYGLLTEHWSQELLEQERAWERHVLDQAARVVFASPLTRRRMAERYPDRAWKFATITNGFDAEATDPPDAPPPPRSNRRMILSFVGTIVFVRGRCYRNPDVLLDGLRILAAEQPRVAGELTVRFVGDCPSVAERAAARGLEGLVEVREAVSVAESHRTMRESDVLLHLQTLDDASRDCIAGKLYDYLGARRPILAIVTPGGGDDWLLRQCDVGPRLGIDDPRAVAAALHTLWRRWRSGALRADADPAWLARFERRRLTAELARLMRDALGEPRAAG